IDLTSIDVSILSAAQLALYNAQLATAKVVVGVSGGCLSLTASVMLVFYIAQYIEKKGKQLGILKAMGYSDAQIASKFWVFGFSTFIGAAIGCALSYAIMPSFYAAQSKDFISVQINFHPSAFFTIILLPAAIFSILSVAIAYAKIKIPVMQLLSGKKTYKFAKARADKKERTFLKDIKRATLLSRKALALLIAFSGFCFSAMIQMSVSMFDVGQMFAVMILVIGLVLALTTLIMGVTALVGRNMQSIALMRAIGYAHKDCFSAVFGGYRPIAYLGFAIGTAYQYGLLKVMFNIVFKNIGAVPDYKFDFAAFAIALAVFAVSYELLTYLLSLKAIRTPLKAFMIE
ncbi:MAG: FtsX-like permease family protein, partial [Clostridia bacterium]|nr:FtsX-like permease family protein [Clostridia bacterium]